MSDGAKGVQWNCWTNSREQSAYVAVNLEGMQYDGWPVARFIERELREPGLLSVCGGLETLAHLDVVWERDAWGAAGNRMPILERFIGETPIQLSTLTASSWHNCLDEAWACLNRTKNGRGRGRQMVTAAGRARENAVSPHLQFRRRLPSVSQDGQADLDDSIRLLTPLHDFVGRQTSQR